MGSRLWFSSASIRSSPVRTMHIGDQGRLSTIHIGDRMSPRLSNPFCRGGHADRQGRRAIVELVGSMRWAPFTLQMPARRSALRRPRSASCRKRGQAGSQHRCADQCQTSEFLFGLVRRTGQDGSGGVGISGSASRVSRRSFRNTSRGTWGSALARLRFRKHELQPATLVLLASRWASEVHQNGSPIFNLLKTSMLLTY